MNTLTGIEAERVNHILRHAIERLNILANIPLTWDNNLLGQIQHELIFNTLQKLWLNEQQLHSLNGFVEDGEDFSIIKQSHRTSRSIARNLQVDKNSLSVIMTYPEMKSDGISLYIKYLNDLRLIVLNRMTTTVEDESAHRTELHDLTEKERRYEESRDTLQKKLENLLEEKDRVTTVLDQSIHKFQTEIQDISQTNAIDLDSVQKEMNEAIQKASADHELRMKILNEQIDNLTKRYNEVTKQNEMTERELRREKTIVENALSSRIRQYDEEMTSKKQQLLEMNESYQREFEEYSILKKHFDQIDADINRNKEEDDILDAVRRRDEFAIWAMRVNKAATRIQKHYRGYKDRCVYGRVNRKKKGKKRGKGKKGKK